MPVMEQKDVIALNKTIGNLTVQMIQQNVPNDDTKPIEASFVDLCFLCRTLLHLDRVLEEQSLPNDHLQQLAQCLHSLQTSVYQPTAAQQQMTSLLAEVNLILSVVRFWKPPASSILYYTEDRVVSRTLDPERYEIGYNAVLEDWSQVRWPDWRDGADVFEHIGMKSGASRFYDPYFFTREQSAAREFFVPGRVFTVLWSPERCPGTNGYIPEEDETVLKYRLQYMVAEGVYTGPYEGPEEVRCFVVVHAGSRSMLCLPVSGSSGHGCLKMSDQRYYGIVHRHDQPSTPLIGENGMFVPAMQVQETPQRQRPLASKKLLREVPPAELLPTGPLPPYARVDYRRWCEVEYGVHCRNVGLVDAQTLLANIEEIQRSAAMTGEATVS